MMVSQCLLSPQVLFQSIAHNGLFGTHQTIVGSQLQNPSRSIRHDKWVGGSDFFVDDLRRRRLCRELSLSPCDLGAVHLLLVSSTATSPIHDIRVAVSIADIADSGLLIDEHWTRFALAFNLPSNHSHFTLVPAGDPAQSAAVRSAEEHAFALDDWAVTPRIAAGNPAIIDSAKCGVTHNDSISAVDEPAAPAAGSDSSSPSTEANAPLRRVAAAAAALCTQQTPPAESGCGFGPAGDGNGDGGGGGGNATGGQVACSGHGVCAGGCGGCVCTGDWFGEACDHHPYLSAHYLPADRPLKSPSRWRRGGGVCIVRERRLRRTNRQTDRQTDRQ
jgi:hypothetical protein